MDKIFVLSGYLLYSIVTINLALMLLGIHNEFRNGIIVGVLAAFSDFIVKEIIVPSLGVFDGFHFISGTLLTAFLLYYFLKLKIGASFGVTIFAAIISALCEAVIALFILLIMGKDFITNIKNNQDMLVILMMIGPTILILPLLYLRKKKFKLINLSMQRNIIG